MSRTNHHGDKKKERLGLPWHVFMSTPMWWIRSMMTKPQRRKASIWQRNVERTPVEALENVDTPNVSRKPHIYYW